MTLELFAYFAEGGETVEVLSFHAFISKRKLDPAPPAPEDLPTDACGNPFS